MTLMIAWCFSHMAQMAIQYLRRKQYCNAWEKLGNAFPTPGQMPSWMVVIKFDQQNHQKSYKKKQWKIWFFSKIESRGIVRPKFEVGLWSSKNAKTDGGALFFPPTVAFPQCWQGCLQPCSISFRQAPSRSNMQNQDVLFFILCKSMTPQKRSRRNM